MDVPWGIVYILHVHAGVSGGHSCTINYRHAVTPLSVARCSVMGTTRESPQNQEQHRAMQDIGATKYRIKFIDEAELPPDQDFVFMECEGAMWLALKCNRLTPAVLEDAWETFRELGQPG